MLPGPMGHKVERFALPNELASGQVDELVVWAVQSGGTTQLTIDFQNTSHIDFRAARSFVTRIRALYPSLPPIRIVGLDPYCEQILRFALGAADWDLFELVSDAGEGSEAASGLGADARDASVGSPASASWGGGSWSSLAGPWAPCPN